MTRFWLIMLRIICIIQALIAIVQCFTSLFGLLTGGGFMSLLQAIAFGFIAALPILTFTIYNNNYPDKLIEGRQKKNFNRIFLINFLLIAFLFGFVFRDYRDAIFQSRSLGLRSGSYLVFFIPFIISCCTLIFQFSVLYGLYWLRQQINNNLSSKQFDFEEENV
jgi:cytochrome bd-type quinol oxidase subunit 2